jgi:hypothetical protein
MFIDKCSFPSHVILSWSHGCTTNCRLFYCALLENDCSRNWVVHCPISIVKCSLSNAHYPIQFTMSIVQCPMSIVQCALSIVQRSLSIVKYQMSIVASFHHSIIPRSIVPSFKCSIVPSLYRCSPPLHQELLVHPVRYYSLPDPIQIMISPPPNKENIKKKSDVKTAIYYFWGTPFHS